MSNRDDFSEQTKRTLRDRAGQLCSAPDCGRFTMEPSGVVNDLALNLGIAAHIHAAAPKGERYDSSQSPEERRDIANGIWLCIECSNRIDKDRGRYSPELLREWKANHEAGIARAIPPTPIGMSMHTLSGFLLPTEGNVFVRASDVAGYKQHTLSFCNDTRATIHGLELFVQFPELILHLDPKGPVGATVRAEPARAQMMAEISGEGASVTVGAPRPLPIWKVEVSELRTTQLLTVVITSALDPEPMRRVPESIRSDALAAFIEGAFIIPYGQKIELRREFLAEISYDVDLRSIALGRVYPSHAVPRRRILAMF